MTITGKVTDSTNEPLTGASVYISDGGGNPAKSLIGTTADASGKYKLNIPVNAEYVTISFVGMAKQTFKVKGLTSKDVVLKPSESTTFKEVEVFADKHKKSNLKLYLCISVGLLLITGSVIYYKQQV